ncbi:hypothetical protein QE400_000202 [Xanthomonas sacchari]|uniref:hypothetical protein n=1 Tax=Xanthomonas sacchari TaxID=56458 RepID=UPI00277FE155|nr:hypothetical protein [Xanthomonas sacchari]MDQ1090789.1 hypothetical protein [Xanthomonas sacchari]
MANLEVRLYFFAMYFFATGMFLFFCGQYLIFDQVMILAMAAASLGFLVWIVPCLLNAWSKSLIRNLMWLVHLGVLLVSAALGRGLLTQATGLPGQDFPLAIGVLSIIMYPLAWMFIAISALSVLTLIFELLLLVPLAIHALLSPFTILLGREIYGYKEERSFRRLGQFIGAASLVAALGAIGGSLPRALPVFERAALWVAYIGDYQVISSYPGIKEGEKVILHDNGVYSVATKRNGDILIEVRIWSPPR